MANVNAQERLARLKASVMSANAFSITPEEVQAYIKIAEELIVALLQQRGLTPEQVREERNRLSGNAQQFIDQELDEYDDEED